MSRATNAELRLKYEGMEIEQGIDGYYGAARCIEYKNYLDITVVFDNDGGTPCVREHVYLNDFLKGNVKNYGVLDYRKATILKKYLGAIVIQGKDGCCGEAECIDVRGSDNLTIRFVETGTVKYNVRARDFVRGELKDYYARTVYGIGYFGEIGGDISRYTPNDYIKWRNMLGRVVNKDSPYYRDVVCSSSFKNFTNFINWLHNLENYNDLIECCQLLNDGCSIDKDLLVKNNKCYSEDACCLVPKGLNGFIGRLRRVNVDGYKYPYPIGLSELRNGRCIRASLQRDLLALPFCRKDVYISNRIKKYENKEYYINLALKYYNHYNIEYDEKGLCAIGIAFEWYKETKEEYIKQIAETYRNFDYNGKTYHLIDERCYNALMNWTIDITD